MRPGRLFRKFFIFFWLAQFTTASGVGLTIWALRPLHPEDRPPPAHRHDMPPGPERAGGKPPPPPPHKSPLSPLLPLAAGSIVSLIFAWWLAWYFSRPIATLREAFEAEASGKLDTRIGKAMGNRQDELADLGKDFDRMAERLQNLVDGQHRLLHDVSHELRSPLARLQAATDLMQQQPERMQEFIERIQRDTRRIDHLVGELLTLARLDTGMENLSHERLELCELVEEIVEDSRFEAEARACRFELDLAAGLVVNGNAELLRRAIENVLRNAVRHAPDASVVKVTAQGEDGCARVSVIDSGGGVDEEDLETIFEPFYRASNAKSFEGYGLGLTITRRVLKLHGGTIKAENLPDGSFSVTLTLPLAS